MVFFLIEPNWRAWCQSGVFSDRLDPITRFRVVENSTNFSTFYFLYLDRQIFVFSIFPIVYSPKYFLHFWMYLRTLIRE